MPNPRRRANSMTISVVDQPPTRAEEVFSALVVGAMMVSGLLLIVF